jgi:hypothetical protein
MRGKDSLLFLKKKKQKDFSTIAAVGGTGGAGTPSQGMKVFWFFFSKKNILPCT